MKKHTPGYRIRCTLGYAFFNISPFKISQKSPCRGGMHKCIPYEKNRRFSIQHTAADYSPGGMHQCTSGLSVGNGFIRSERSISLLGSLDGDGFPFFNVSPFKMSWGSPCRGGMHKCIPYEKIRRFAIRVAAAKALSAK